MSPPAPRRAFRRRFQSLALLWLLAVVVRPQMSVAAPNDLQAHGSDDRLWLARVEPLPPKPGAEVTTLFLREKFKNEWRRLDPIAVRVGGLASRGSQLAVLLPGGDWRLMTETGLASGRPLPYPGKIIALGGDPSNLWAVGEVTPVDLEKNSTKPTTGPASQPSATQPTTATTLPTTSPTTSPTVSAATTAPTQRGATLRLFRLGPQAWEDRGPLPDGVVTGDRAALSLGAAGGSALLAHRPSPRQIDVYRFAPGDTWQPIGTVEAPDDVQALKLLGGTATPVLWFRGATGPGRLWMQGPSGAQPITRELPGVPAGADHALTHANGAIRVLWVQDDKIFDQRLKPDTGDADGDPMPLPLPAVSIQPQVTRWAQITLMSAVVFALAASVRRRREMQEAELDPAKLGLAPFSLRLLAGLIDGVPLLVSSWLVRDHPPEQADLRSIVTVLVGIGTYILWTTLFELIAGRSLGKLLTGLRVVGLDGKPAPASARLTRNLLRIIDLPVLPLALILFSPLRQRAGDLAAGTTVVQGKPTERDESKSDDDAPAEESRDKDEDRK